MYNRPTLPIMFYSETSSVLRILLIGIVIALLTTACDSEPPPESKGISENNVFKDQIDTLDKARQVEGVLMDGAQHRAQEIEQQTSN